MQAVASVQPLLCAGGQLHLSLKRGEPYDSWQAVQIAKLCGLRVQSCTPFLPQAFPGYAHRRSIGDEHAGDAAAHAPNAEIGANSKTYAFVSAADTAAAAAGSAARGDKDEAWKQEKWRGKKKFRNGRAF